MRSDTIQQMGKRFGCLTFASAAIGVVYLAGAIFSLCFGTMAWALQGFKISALLIGVPLVLWGALVVVVQRIARHPETEQTEEQASPPAEGEETFQELDADIEFEVNGPYSEAKYDAVLPVFSRFFVECDDHGKSVQDFIRFFVRVYGDGVVPYLTRFVAESGAADHLRNEKKCE